MRKPLDFSRLSLILEMLDDRTDDNTRLAAISRANAMLAAAGMSWTDLIHKLEADGEAQATGPVPQSAMSPNSDFKPYGPFSARSTPSFRPGFSMWA